MVQWGTTTINFFDENGEVTTSYTQENTPPTCKNCPRPHIGPCSSPPRRCYSCNGLNHIARHCPSLHRSRNEPSLPHPFKEPSPGSREWCIRHNLHHDPDLASKICSSLRRMPGGSIFVNDNCIYRGEELYFRSEAVKKGAEEDRDGLKAEEWVKRERRKARNYARTVDRYVPDYSRGGPQRRSRSRSPERSDRRRVRSRSPLRERSPTPYSPPSDARYRAHQQQHDAYQMGTFNIYVPENTTFNNYGRGMVQTPLQTMNQGRELFPNMMDPRESIPRTSQDYGRLSRPAPPAMPRAMRVPPSMPQAMRAQQPSVIRTDDPCFILGIDRNAGEEEIQNAYIARRLEIDIDRSADVFAPNIPDSVWENSIRVIDKARAELLGY